MTGRFTTASHRWERITLAALVIGLGASVVLVAVAPINEFLLMGTYLAGNHFPIGAFAALLVLTAVGQCVRRQASSQH